MTSHDVHSADEQKYGDRHIVIRRVFNAPPELVWQAWTDPDRLTHWWGPEGFSTTTHSRDLKAGGIWRFTMHGPDGVDYPNRVTFHEVLPAQKLVYSHDNDGVLDTEPIAFQTTVLFEKQGENKTRLTLSLAFPTTEARDHVKNTYGAVQGGMDTVSRFAAQLSKLDGVAGDQQAITVALPDDKQIVMRWSMDSTPEKIFKAYSHAEYLRQWWGCPTFEVTTCQSDFREGGQWRIVQKAPDGQVHPFKGVYQKIVKPCHITHTFIYDVEEIRDFECIETLDLVQQHDQTLMTMTCSHQSIEARDGQMSSGMVEGVTTSMKRLGELVKTF